MPTKTQKPLTRKRKRDIMLVRVLRRVNINTNLFATEVKRKTKKKAAKMKKQKRSINALVFVAGVLTEAMYIYAAIQRYPGDPVAIVGGGIIGLANLFVLTQLKK